MRFLMSVLSILLAIVVLSPCSGCMSIWSAQCSKSEILRNRIMASGDQDAIKALKSGVSEEVCIRAVQLDNGAGIGVDVSNLDALTEHPWRQLGAALLDVGTAAAAAVGGQALMQASNSDDDSSSQTAGRDIIQVTVDGRNNTINVGDQSSETTTTAE